MSLAKSESPTCRVTSSGLFAAKNMNQIKLLSSQTGLTMSSLELVQFINNQRDVGASELAHSDFLKKVQQVLKNETVELVS